MKWYLFVCLLGFVPAVAAGQTSTGVDAQLFRPPATSAGLLGVDEGDIPSHLSTSFGLFTHWTRTPVQLRTTSDELSSGPLISNLVGSDLQGSLGLWDLFEVGFAIPVTLYRSGATSLPGTPALSSTGLGDVRVGIRGVPLRMDLGPGQLLLGVTAGLAL
ncbi:MAG TPA: hypothetical protein VK420_00045, partial [Longimicrobium sp.]|nr:hypothetical protein [Longimicrobium sp.]